MAFPQFNFSWLAWLAPGLMLWSTQGTTAKKVFWAGWVSGLGCYLVSLYWIFLMPFPWHGMVGYLGLCAVLSLFTGAWCWLSWCLRPNRWRAALAQSSNKNKGKRKTAVKGSAQSCPWPGCELWPLLVWPLCCAAGWVAQEMTTARIFGGFPYNPLGASQFHRLSLIQIASVTGVYGVSFLVAWLSVALMVAFRQVRMWMLHKQASSGKRRAGELAGLLALPALAVVAASLFGMNQLARSDDCSSHLKIALIQPAIPQVVLWDEQQQTNRLRKIVELSQAALTARPDLLVWPESAMAGILGRNRLTQEMIGHLLLSNGAWMVFGGNDTHPKPGAVGADEVDAYNAAFLVDAKGELVGRYYKRHLVMFGEYMPGARWLPVLARLRSAGAGMRPGKRSITFQLEQPPARFAPLICYEDVFPHEVRSRANPETDFLLNLTNDGWFGQSAAQWQHAQTALFRAVENGLPLVRCANNGLTCWIDSRGRIHDVCFSDTEGIYGPGYKVVTVPLCSATTGRCSTFYNRHGDWFGWSCVGLTLLAGGFRFGRCRMTDRNS
ncbi:MAG TPA: apolipoprotein N-acyltransferase [Verrucomicrobiota bacterium]|nr:apolipoprotein N-acyltransferase [Verrucomicrobiota bacterium]HQB15456.1 apolipoprotein N-acyltransferase [Verrucomicrobiota bacterium]